ncbi:hypothetical protein LEP1GSC052_2293 [Leptospira kmetyi serovar Malaysia str. Bejo-Iso9]|nr:hypothetical protein LEP1GSC052_2293 [Leptospira kmetyi serovar Malaysia str. Bejo-Iso9]
MKKPEVLDSSAKPVKTLGFQRVFCDRNFLNFDGAGANSRSNHLD